MKTSKTIELLNRAKDILILLPTKTNGQFTAKQVRIAFEQNGINPAIFYHFVNAGVFTKKDRGVFVLNNEKKLSDLIFEETMQKVYELSAKVIVKKRKLKNKQQLNSEMLNKKQTTLSFGVKPKNIKTNTTITDSMILHLKSMGYKIMKPVHRFEEI